MGIRIANSVAVFVGVFVTAPPEPNAGKPPIERLVKTMMMIEATTKNPPMLPAIMMFLRLRSGFFSFGYTIFFSSASE